MEKQNDTMNKVVNLIFEEFTEDGLNSRFPEYAEKEDAYRAKLEKLMQSLSADQGQELPDTNELENAVFDLLALTEKLSFEDGFRAALRHMLELKNFAYDEQ